MSFESPPVMTRMRLRSADGAEFSFVIDVAPETVQEAWAQFDPERGRHGLMLLHDRRSDGPGQQSGVNWQVWTSSVTGWDATDSDEPIPLPPSQGGA